MFTLCFTAYVILISFNMHSSDVGLVVALVWPPKSLRSQKVELGRKRLCTTALDAHLIRCPQVWRYSFLYIGYFCIGSPNPCINIFSLTPCFVDFPPSLPPFRFPWYRVVAHFNQLLMDS